MRGGRPKPGKPCRARERKDSKHKETNGWKADVALGEIIIIIIIKVRQKNN